jgi:hypothetical protein
MALRSLREHPTRLCHSAVFLRVASTHARHTCCAKKVFVASSLGAGAPLLLRGVHLSDPLSAKAGRFDVVIFGGFG